METSTLLSAHSWAEQTFGEVQLGHRRRRERAVKMAAAIAADPAGSVPKQMGSEAALHAAYRFLQTPQVSYEHLLRPHQEPSRAAMRKSERVFLIQDPTEVDSQQQPTTTRLGPIGNGTPHGFLLQTVLAVLPENREGLGIAPQEPFLRQRAPKEETKRERLGRVREWQVWERRVQVPGAPPPGAPWIHIGDRSSDMFPFLALCRQQHCDFVGRAAPARRVDLLVEQAQGNVPKRSPHRRSAEQEAASKPQHLFEVVRGWSEGGQQERDWPATKPRRARQAQVVIRYGAVRLLPPQEQQARYPHPLVVWVVPVWEPQPPADVEPLEGGLLPSIPIQTGEQAWERVDWDRARWIVEEYHQGLKTGCRLEQRQVHSYEGWPRLLGLLAPSAVRLLQRRAAARESPEQPVVEVLPADVVQVVATLAQVPAATVTTQPCCYLMAGYGGYLARKGDGPPGWNTLWKGWLYMQAVLEGVHLAARLALNWDSS